MAEMPVAEHGEKSGRWPAGRTGGKCRQAVVGPAGSAQSAVGQAGSGQACAGLARQPGLRVEPLTAEHLPQACRMFMAAFNAPPWNDAWTEETAGRRLAQLLGHQEALGLAAYTEDGFAGWILGEREQYYDGVVFQVKEFCVDAAYQAQGLGAKILGELERRLLAEGVKEITLLTSTDEKPRRFYGRQGYRESDKMGLMAKELRRG